MSWRQRGEARAHSRVARAAMLATARAPQAFVAVAGLLFGLALAASWQSLHTRQLQELTGALVSRALARRLRGLTLLLR